MNGRKLAIDDFSYDVKDMKECFVTGKQSKGVGDHLYEVNGYHRYTGKRGINDKWKY